MWCCSQSQQHAYVPIANQFVIGLSRGGRTQLHAWLSACNAGLPSIGEIWSLVVYLFLINPVCQARKNVAKPAKPFRSLTGSKNY